jgi:hypothetical protein
MSTDLGATGRRHPTCLSSVPSGERSHDRVALIGTDRFVDFHGLAVGLIGRLLHERQGERHDPCDLARP